MLAMLFIKSQFIERSTALSLTRHIGMPVSIILLYQANVLAITGQVDCIHPISVCALVTELRNLNSLIFKNHLAVTVIQMASIKTNQALSRGRNTDEKLHFRVVRRAQMAQQAPLLGGFQLLRTLPITQMKFIKNNITPRML